MTGPSSRPRVYRVVVDRYAALSVKQRVAGAAWSLVLAQSFGGFDVSGGVGADALRPLSDLEVSDFLHAELLREIAALAGDVDAGREVGMEMVVASFVSDPPRDLDLRSEPPRHSDTLGLVDHFRRVARAADRLAYARYGQGARQLGLADERLGLPPGDRATLAGARVALEVSATADDAPEHFGERLLYAVAEVVDRALRLRLSPDATPDARRVEANAMIRDRFLDLGLPVPSEPAID